MTVVKPVQTCLLKNTPPPLHPHGIDYLVATKACTVCKRAVRIVLECFFVVIWIMIYATGTVREWM